MENKIKFYGIIIIVLVIVLLVFCGLYFFNASKCSDMVNSSEGFKNEPKNGNTSDKAPVITLYYALWCGICKGFLPEWEKFEEYAKTNLTHIRVDRVRCEDGNEATCQQKGIEGYPTVLLSLPNGKDIAFDGERSMEGLIKFIKSRV